MKLLEDGGAFPRRRNYLSPAKPLRCNVRETLHPIQCDFSKRKEMKERREKKKQQKLSHFLDGKNIIIGLKFIRTDDDGRHK